MMPAWEADLRVPEARVSLLCVLAIGLTGPSACQDEAKPAKLVELATPVVHAQASLASSAKETEPPQMSPEDKGRAEALARHFGDQRGELICVVHALRELRGLRQRFGTQPPLRASLLAAYLACDEKVAVAELLAQTLGDKPSVEPRLNLGFAWLRAVRYDDAALVLLPLAQELGPKTQAGWSAGYALAYGGKYEEALPWLEGARDIEDGPSAVDASALIGLCKLNMGDTAAAISELELGLESGPKHPPLLTLLSRAYTEAGRSEDEFVQGRQRHQRHHILKLRVSLQVELLETQGL